MTSEKEHLIASFFKIRGNEQVKNLQICKAQCERFLLKEDDSTIKDLYNVINALIVYFETNNKAEARKWVVDLWYNLYSKNELSLFEIRILNCILFTEPKIEKVIENVEDCLIQLENYKFHEDYMKIKITLNSNLLELLMDAKFFDKKFKNEFNELISQLIEEIISLNLSNNFNNKYSVGIANIYKGIILKDDIKIYTGLLDLQNSSQNNSHSIQQLIKIYIEKYSISKSQHTSLLIQKMNQKFNI